MKIFFFVSTGQICSDGISVYILSYVLTLYIYLYTHFMTNSLLQVSISENPSQFCTLILAVIVMTLQIFVPCYCGNEIILSSGALNNAIYNADWIQCSPKMRKYLIIYMEMLQVPVKVRAGNFFEIGLPVFVKVTINVIIRVDYFQSLHKKKMFLFCRQ